MHIFKARPKPWGNSMGVTIPKSIVRDAKISSKTEETFLLLPKPGNLRKLFGSLPSKKPVQQIMDEIDEGYD